MEEIIQYSLVAIASFLGIVMGNVLVFIAPEELEPGRRWFRIVSSSIMTILCLTAMNSMIYKFFAAPVGFAVIFFLSDKFTLDKKMRKFL
ncbi:MAG: hypothetical protein ACOCUR_01665, partial [Nanoarchaeota archaeon]